MLVVKRANIGLRISLKDILLRNAFAGCGPHIGYIKILGAIVLVIEPANSHTRADILNAPHGSNVRESSVPIVAVKILSTEIIHHIEVGPAILVEIVPCATKAITRIVLDSVWFRSSHHGRSRPDRCAS